MNKHSKLWKIFNVPVTCSVCGGDGLASPKTSAWAPVAHVDPAVCREVLAEREEAIAKVEFGREHAPLV